MKSLLHAIKRRLRRTQDRIILWKRIIGNYAYDAQRFLKYSTTLEKPKDPAQLEAKIVARTHVIEKGLSLEKTRLGYGQANVESLIDLLARYEREGYPTNGSAYRSAVSTLQTYAKFHKDNDYDLGELGENIRTLPQEMESLGGALSLTREEILAQAKLDFRVFSKARYSIRHFSDKPVDLSLIKEAVHIAQEAPSSCNRQATRVYIIQDRSVKDAVLEYQIGNRGFGHLADAILVITFDQRCFFDLRERNLGFIDAGIFSLSLLYSLHYVGLGACSLNWAVEKERDEDLRRLIDIPDSEVIVLLIAAGHLPERLQVARSARKDLDEILRIV